MDEVAEEGGEGERGPAAAGGEVGAGGASSDDQRSTALVYNTVPVRVTVLCRTCIRARVRLASYSLALLLSLGSLASRARGTRARARTVGGEVIRAFALHFLLPAMATREAAAEAAGGAAVQGCLCERVLMSVVGDDIYAQGNSCKQNR